MITCNRCGSISPASAMNCQNCGAPLSSKAENGLGPARGFQEQPELPAWLGSLRAGERPAAPADNSSNFSTADLIEEGSLPSWMRSGRPEASDTGMSSPQLSLRPSSAPGPNTDDTKGINAKSLIDEQSLPSWMQENKPPTTSIPQGGIAASSLLQQDLMPDWMKSLQQNSPFPDAGSPPAKPTPASPPAFSEKPKADRTNEAPARPVQGFSARDLVDQQSLPSWMQQQEGLGSAPVQPGPGATISPSSLLDLDSLPPWLRESGKQEPKSGPMPSVQANSPWQSAQPPMQGGGMQQPSFGQPAPSPTQQGSPVWQPEATPQASFNPGMNNMPAQGGGLSASSFIDPNALPQWLRSGSEQQNQMGSAMPPQRPVATPRSGYGVPPRVENVRVPSRPRGELNPNENNEAAANVFASMLGVASTTPNFPGAPPAQGYGMQGGGSFGQGMSAPPFSPMQGSPAANNIPGQIAGAPPGFNNPQGMQGSQAQGYAPGGFNSGIYQTGNQSQGNYSMGNSFAGASQYPAGGPGTGNLGMGTESGQRTSAKPAKKGLFDMIRDWFR